MIKIDNLLQVANQIETERGVSKDILFQALEQALASACRKKLNDGSQIECKLNSEAGDLTFFRVKEVCSDIISEQTEILVKDAQEINPDSQEGDEVLVEFEPPDFGRIAALIAKQVIVQRLREAEKDSVYDEFQDKVNQIINGTVQRVENRNYLVNLGRTEAILRGRDQIPNETFYANDPIRVYVVGIEKTNRGNEVHISRTHPGLLQRLFELEIPEIADGIIEVMSVSREAGVRAKVAVKTNNPSIGAVGTCVGQMGGRIQAIIKELGNEKIDVLEWDEDPKVFIANALKPAKISSVFITDEEEKQATVVVQNDQLSLAIGKQGINVRLSVNLTGWRLNILDEEAFKNEKQSILSQSKNVDMASDSEDLSLENSFLAKAISKDAKASQESETTNTETHDEDSPADEDLIKVSDLAKEMKLKTAELIQKAADVNIEIKHNRVKLTPDQVSEIKEKVAT